ncbi:MAG: hypothetical protein ACKO1U_06985 [Bacteroidota bacterium]
MNTNEKSSEPSAAEPAQYTFEFAVNPSPAEAQEEKPMEMEWSTEVRSSAPATEESETSEEDEYFRKSRERLARLKALNYRLGSGNVGELEKEPAYKRKNVKLDAVPHSSESNVSRYTLSNEEEKKPQIRSNNSFLHDNVD